MDMETSSLRTPNDLYLKSRRALVFVSGLLLLSIFIGLIPDANDGTFTIFSIRLRSTDSVPTVFLIVLIYSVWQYWSSWLVQTEEVRNFVINRADVIVSLAIALLSAAAYFWPSVQGLFAKQSASLVAAFLGATTAILGFLYSNTRIRSRLKRKATEEQSRLTSKLTNTRWVHTYNPQHPNGKKEITFAESGEIAIGRNDNESRWRIQEGTLEILNSAGQVFSRFRYKEKEDAFEHTNDADTLSLRSQRIDKLQ